MRSHYDSRAFIDEPHNPAGKGWKNNVRGCFQRKPRKIDHDGCLIGIQQCIIIILVSLLIVCWWQLVH